MRRVALLVLLAVLGCRDQPPPERAPYAVAEDPVPAPETLLLEATLRSPDASWGGLRTGAGGPLLSLPSSAAEAVVTASHLDPRLARFVSGTAPFQLALGDAGGEAGGVVFALAMKLKDVEAAHEQLLEAETSSYTGKAVGSLTVLVPRSAAAAPLAAALSPSGYLVLASSEAAVATLGAYAARTMPTRPVATSSLQLRAAAATLHRNADRAADLVDRGASILAGAPRGALAPAVDVRAFVDCLRPGPGTVAGLVADLAAVTVDVDTGSGEVHGVVSLSPGPGDGAARKRLRALHPGDAAPLLDVPRDAVAALFSSDLAAGRQEDAATLATCVGRALGATLDADGRGRLDRAFSAWARGRGDWETVALASSSPAEGFVLRAASADVDAASGSLRDFAELARRPPLGDAVQRWLGVKAGVVQPADLGPAGRATVLAFPRKPRAGGATTPGPAAPEPLGMAWVTDARQTDVALGQAPKELLAFARSAPGLGTEAAASRAVKALGADASLAAVIRPFGCCKTGGPTAAPLTVGLGRRGEEGWARFEMGYELLLQLVARAGSQ